MKCKFTQEIVGNLYAIVTAIEQYFAEIEGKRRDLWIDKPLSIEALLVIDDMAAKIEFLKLREDSNLKIDFAKKDMGNFSVRLQNENLILSRKALGFLI